MSKPWPKRRRETMGRDRRSLGSPNLRTEKRKERIMEDVCPKKEGQNQRDLEMASILRTGSVLFLLIGRDPNFNRASENS